MAAVPADAAIVIWMPGEDAARAEAVGATVSADVAVLDGLSTADALTASGRADLVVVVPGMLVGGDWLAPLAAAARSDTTIASASAMLSGGPWVPDRSDAAADAPAVARRSLRLRPRIAEPLAGCVLLRRPALDLVAGTVAATSSPAAWLAEIGGACTNLGLSHVLADDVLVGGRRAEPTPDEALALERRHPHLAVARDQDAEDDSPVRRAVRAAHRDLTELTVTIDGRALGPTRAGTQVHALELVAALGRTGRVGLRVVTPPDLDPDARAAFEAIAGLELLPYADALGDIAATDVVHRPSQVFSMSDLLLLMPLGRRLVVTHQDLIAYRAPAYHESTDTWLRYRRATQHALAGADRVVFFSEHARDDAIADDLLDAADASVVPIGVDHRVLTGALPARPPELAADVPFLVCIGADLRHKNHRFARLLAARLREDHGWEGLLVFAGPRGGPGAADDDEHPATLRLGPVGEPEKAWLIAHAAAVVYPTVYEGFGLVPFEAGAAGTPCLFAAQSALAETLPPELATIVPWDAGASAAAAIELLHAGAARRAHVAGLRAAARRYRWDETARALIDVYEELLIAPRREAHRARRLLLEGERLREQEWRRFEDFRTHVGGDGLGLVGPGGAIPRADQRALLSLMSRKGVSRPLLGAARAAYALNRRLRGGADAADTPE
ncbi:MAG: hypothetical protein QOJ63_455 [Solirubrobacteraceae bacterium]|nr:hypothetical protein [Solirubrobacteraceae bacterium]